MKNAIFYTLTFLALQIVGMQLVQLAMLLTGWNAGVAMAALVGLIVSSTATVFVFLRLQWAFAPKAFVQSRPWGVLAWAVVAAAGVVIPSMAVQEMMPTEWLPQALKDMMTENEQLMMQMLNLRGGYFVVCLLVPLTEELVFRGGVLRALLAWRPNRWGMIAVSALVFALVHGNPAQMPHAFAVGLLLGWMYERTGSILPGVVYHWVNNTAAYLLYHAYPDPDITLSDIFGHQQRAVWMAVGFSLLILLPALFQLNLRMRKPGEPQSK